MIRCMENRLGAPVRERPIYFPSIRALLELEHVPAPAAASLCAHEEDGCRYGREGEEGDEQLFVVAYTRGRQDRDRRGCRGRLYLRERFSEGRAGRGGR